MTSETTAAPSGVSRIGDYYSAAQLRSDRWSALKDCAQRLAMAAAQGAPQQRLKDKAGALLEALEPIGAEIVEGPADEAGFIAAAKNADAIYGKGIPMTKAIIDSLENCKCITLGTVGVDSVDIKAATARGIPVTNIPDTFIEEVADHAMALLLAGFRRVVEQDKMVREGRWKEGRRSGDRTNS